MEIYTREFLQNYKKDVFAYSLAKKIVQDVVRQAQLGGSRYFQRIDERNGIEFSSSHNRDVDDRIQVVVRFLKQMLPDSLVEYKTASRLDGTIESGIVIDWS